jgi:hypothetical protein
MNMNLDNLKDIWQAQDETVDRAIAINQPKLASIDVSQQMEKLRHLKISHVFQSLFFFIIIVSLWGYIVNDFTFSAATISAMILTIFATIGFAGNIGQLKLISQFDYSAPIKKLQGNMYSIFSHKLQLTKLALLSVPLYMSYTFLGFDLLFGVDLYQHLSQQMVMFYALSTTIFFVITVWLLSKLTYKNIDYPWVKWMMGYMVGQQLIELAEFLNTAETA